MTDIVLVSLLTFTRSRSRLPCGLEGDSETKACPTSTSRQNTNEYSSLAILILNDIQTLYKSDRKDRVSIIRALPLPDNSRGFRVCMEPFVAIPPSHQSHHYCFLEHCTETEISAEKKLQPKSLWGAWLHSTHATAPKTSLRMVDMCVDFFHP